MRLPPPSTAYRIARWRDAGCRSAGGSRRASTSSIRRWRSPDQTAQARSGCIVTRLRGGGVEGLQHALLEDLHLLLRILQRGLAELQQLRAPPVGGERFGERQLPAFHRRD